jgi:hypothetical protein
MRTSALTTFPDLEIIRPEPEEPPEKINFINPKPPFTNILKTEK